MDACRTDDADRCQLAHYAHRQQRSIDTILTPQRWQRRYRWWTGPADPELAKNLLIFRGLIGEAAELCERGRLDQDERCRLVTAMTLPDQKTSSEAGPVQAATDIPDEGMGPNQRGRGKPGGSVRTEAPALKVVLAARFQLEQMLLELADPTYLTGRLAGLYGEGTGTYVTWKGMFGDSLPALLDPGDAAARRRDVPDVAAAGKPVQQATPCCTCAAVINHEVERTRLQLIRLLRQKEAEDQVTRARHELIDRAMPKTICVVLGIAAVFAVISFRTLHYGQLLVLAMVSGGTGAALGGLIKLRDQVQWGTQARRFFPAFICQVLIGSIAGTLAFLISISLAGAMLATKDASVAIEARVAILALALGFSEAAFLSLLTRFTDPKIT